jgi:hypothetical protein
MERQLERLKDEEEYLLGLMLELARLIEGPNGPVSERLKFGLTQGFSIKSAELQAVNVDLVALARFIVKQILQNQSLSGDLT